MDSGYYAAFSGWLARSQALDVAAGNLANAGTAGYRAERDYFRSAILGPDALNSQLNTTVNAFGVLGGSRLDLGQGALTPTGILSIWRLKATVSSRCRQNRGSAIRAMGSSSGRRMER